MIIDLSITLKGKKFSVDTPKVLKQVYCNVSWARAVQCVSVCVHVPAINWKYEKTLLSEPSEW